MGVSLSCRDNDSPLILVIALMQGRRQITTGTIHTPDVYRGHILIVLQMLEVIRPISGDYWTFMAMFGNGVMIGMEPITEMKLIPKVLGSVLAVCFGAVGNFQLIFWR